MKKLLGFQMGATLALLTLVVSLPALAKPPRHIPSHEDHAYIINSGTRTLPGYRIYVGSDGHLQSVTLQRNGRTSGGRNGSLIPAVSRRFFSDLAHAGPVGSLPTRSNARQNKPDLAPNIRVYIRYHGRQSPDLRRASSLAGERLLQDAKQIIQVLRLPVPDTQ